MPVILFTKLPMNFLQSILENNPNPKINKNNTFELKQIKNTKMVKRMKNR